MIILYHFLECSRVLIQYSVFTRRFQWFDSDLMIIYLFILILIYLLIISFSVYIFFGNIYLLFSGKSGVWSNDKVLLDLPMESASCLKFSISNLTSFLTSVSLILFRTPQILFIRVLIHITQLLKRRVLLEKNWNKDLPVYFSYLELNRHSIKVANRVKLIFRIWSFSGTQYFWWIA